MVVQHGRVIYEPCLWEKNSIKLLFLEEKNEDDCCYSGLGSMQTAKYYGSDIEQIEMGSTVKK